MQFQVYFGAAQTGVGYQFYDADGLIGLRVTIGITNPITGVYVASATLGANAIGIYWDCDDPNFTAQEDLAIRAKTDQLTFTVPNQVDANTQSINDTTITGDGQPGTEFGV